MATDDTGKIAQGDASKQPPLEASNPIEEAHILEEHVLAPKTPVQAPPTAAPQATVPKQDESLLSPEEIQAKKSSFAILDGVKNNIASILEGVKLPERRVEKAAAPRAYDTSLAAHEKSEEEKKAAHEQAIQAARAITQKMTTEKPTDIRALHTLKDDLQEVVRDKKISLVRAVALEEEKRHHGSALEEHTEEVQKKERTHFGLFVAGVLFLIGLIAIGAVLFIMSERSAKSAAPITAQVLFAEQSVPLPIDGMSPADIRREIGNARQSGSLTLGAILQIVPVATVRSDAGSALVPVTFSEFLTAIDAKAPPELGRSLSDEFFIGLHTVDENAPLIVVPVVSYERAFAAMLAWESTLSGSLDPMFTSVPPQATGPDGLPYLRVFEDEVMRNYDVRVLKDDSGTIQLYYSFPTRNVLIIAESPYSFSEILAPAG